MDEPRTAADDERTEADEQLADALAASVWATQEKCEVCGRPMLPPHTHPVESVTSEIRSVIGDSRGPLVTFISEDEEAPVMHVSMRRSAWADMGHPRVVTVTVKRRKESR